MSAIKGEIIPPTRAQEELEPMPTFLMAVGKSSAERTYIVAKAAVAKSFPSIARAVVRYWRSGQEDRIINKQL